MNLQSDRQKRISGSALDYSQHFDRYLHVISDNPHKHTGTETPERNEDYVYSAVLK